MTLFASLKLCKSKRTPSTLTTTMTSNATLHESNSAQSQLPTRANNVEGDIGLKRAEFDLNRPPFVRFTLKDTTELPLFDKFAKLNSSQHTGTNKIATEKVFPRIRVNSPRFKFGLRIHENNTAETQSKEKYNCHPSTGEFNLAFSGDLFSMLNFKVKPEQIDCVCFDEIYSNSHKTLGNIYFASGKYEQAIDCYTKAIEACAKNAVYFGNRAAAYFMLEKLSEALSDSRMATSIDESYVKVNFFCVDLMR